MIRMWKYENAPNELTHLRDFEDLSETFDGNEWVILTNLKFESEHTELVVRNFQYIIETVIEYKGKKCLMAIVRGQGGRDIFSKN